MLPGSALAEGFAKQANAGRMSPAEIMVLIRKLKQVKGRRGRIYMRLLEARLHELERRESKASRKKNRR